jgi:hypothetical protein
MGKFLRSLLAVVLGLIAAGLVIAAVEGIDSVVFPLPAGVDPSNRESLAAAMADVPVGALLLVLLGWCVGTFAGAWVAARVAGRAPLLHGLILGGLLLAVAVLNMLALPHPAWFWALALSVFLPAAYLGVRMARSTAAVPSQPLAAD